MVRPKQTGPSFDLLDYYRYPDKYEAAFEQYLPHLTVLVNCIYWDARYPRLVTKEFTSKKSRLLKPRLDGCGAFAITYRSVGRHVTKPRLRSRCRSLSSEGIRQHFHE